MNRIDEIKDLASQTKSALYHSQRGGMYVSDVNYLLSIIEKYEYEDKVKWIERLLNERLVILSDKRIDSAEIEGRCKELELTLQAIRK